MSTWDDFTSDVEKDSSIARQGPRCKTCKLLVELPREGAEALGLALDDGNVTSTSIRRALMFRVEQKQIPSAYSISRHRRGDCRKW